ncbi:hypothetical protein [Peribacillus sp. TH14]|uniref:hypothetical protein n=1 Tax=Peribacillus sp. TH14 TaxID=2798481 RepID=UPI0019119417|nr:hypothetical protein [Peribacillus sp. TH14]MBK5500711.1 hypothetical protein [Peribacillus sp. TH14]
MDKKKPRVLFLVNIPSPYRVNFFKELGKSCELTVLFERETSQERDMSWYDNDFNNFKAIFLNGVKFKKNMAICFNVASYLKKDLFDIIIVGGYSTPTGMLAIKILKQRKIPFILNTDGGLIKDDTKIKYAIKKYFISSATYWLCTGEETKKYLLYYGAHEKNIFTYPFTSILEKDVLKNITKKNMKNELKRATKYF